MTDFSSDPALNRCVQQRFTQLRDTSDPDMKSLASKVIDGRVDPRDALRSGAFRQVLVSAVNAQAQRIKKMSPEELAQAADQGKKDFDLLLSGDRKGRTEDKGVRANSEDKHEECVDEPYFERESWLEG